MLAMGLVYIKATYLKLICVCVCIQKPKIFHNTSGQTQLGFVKKNKTGVSCLTIFLAMIEIGRRISLSVRLEKNVDNKFLRDSFCRRIKI